MLQQTDGIVLRAIKYGETSIVTNIFTRHFGVQTYLVQGVRSSSSRNNRAALFQPATLLELVAYNKPQSNLQRLREFSNAYIYRSLQEEVVKNSIALFSVELLLRLLPEQAPLPELFKLAFGYFQELDRRKPDEVANLPLFFIIEISRHLGYELKGSYTASTTHLNLADGGFMAFPPTTRPFVQDEDAQALSRLLDAEDLNAAIQVKLHAEMRFRLLDWYLEFLHRHTEHLGQIKSLSILRTILH